MKLVAIIITVVGLLINSMYAQESCLDKEKLIALDASWEKAQLELDFNFIDSLLAEDYIWIHNHANTIDDKAAVLERIKRYIKLINHELQKMLK